MIIRQQPPSLEQRWQQDLDVLRFVEFVPDRIRQRRHSIIEDEKILGLNAHSLEHAAARPVFSNATVALSCVKSTSTAPDIWRRRT